MIILTCPDCYSTKITRYEGRMTDKGYSWFSCKECSKNFSLEKADYREEMDLYE